MLFPHSQPTCLPSCLPACPTRVPLCSVLLIISFHPIFCVRPFLDDAQVSAKGNGAAGGEEERGGRGQGEGVGVAQGLEGGERECAGTQPRDTAKTGSSNKRGNDTGAEGRIREDEGEDEEEDEWGSDGSGGRESDLWMGGNPNRRGRMEFDDEDEEEDEE